MLLVRAFRSLLLPLKAIVLNLLSIGAAYGLLVPFFKWGVGEPLGLTAVRPDRGLDPGVPVRDALRPLDGLRGVPRQPHARGVGRGATTTRTRSRDGLAKTGRIVTAAGLIMVAAFMGFVAGSIVGLQQFGFGLAVAILIDVTIVRALLVPSAMELFGRWNWWLPERRGARRPRASRRRSAAHRRDRAAADRPLDAR